MKKILILILMMMWIVPEVALCAGNASGYLFLGKYLNYEKQDLDGRDTSYYAGIYLEIESKWATFFVQDKTLIRDIDKGSSFPKQINYTIGIKKKIKSFEIKIKHECLHPVDGVNGGENVTSYNLIEGRFNF